MKKNNFQKRNKEIARKFASGKFFMSDIAEEYDMTRERARQIIRLIFTAEQVHEMVRQIKINKE